MPPGRSSSASLGDNTKQATPTLHCLVPLFIHYDHASYLTRLCYTPLLSIFSMLQRDDKCRIPMHCLPRSSNYECLRCASPACIRSTTVPSVVECSTGLPIAPDNSHRTNPERPLRAIVVIPRRVRIRRRRHRVLLQSCLYDYDAATFFSRKNLPISRIACPKVSVTVVFPPIHFGSLLRIRDEA